MADNVQHKIARNRPPRVQITYDVEIGNAIEKTEIPFVVGIMADLSGYGDTVPADRKPLKDKSRSFVEIDRDNFGDVMAKIAPSLTSATLKDGAFDESGKVVPALVFKSLDDFGPDKLAQRIKDISELQTKRSALRDVLTKLDSNDALYADLMARAKGGTLQALGDAAHKQQDAIEKATTPATT